MVQDDFTLAQGEALVMSSVRGLVGWMNDTEATNFLLGHQPTPTDDLTHIQQIIKDCHEAAATRPVYNPVNPITDMDNTSADGIKARPDIQTAFAPLKWSPAMADLREVLSFQSLVNLEGLEDRVVSSSNNTEDLLKLCLPVSESLSQLGGIVDPDQKGYTISSLNPNLRIQGSLMHEMDINILGLPPMKRKAVSFLMDIPTSYLQVVHYKDRYFIRDGYHRAAGLLKANINIVPCILIEARDGNELGLQQGTFAYEVIYGDRPPKLSDFWDDTVAHDGKQVAKRRVLRIRGEEFFVQR